MGGTPREGNRLPKLGSRRDDALAELMPVLYSELRRRAAHYLRRERRNHTLQTTALVHEAYLRLVAQKEVNWGNREQFLGVAAQLMRRILVDYSRSHQAAKRGGNADKVFLEEAAVVCKEKTADVVAVDSVLSKLAEFDPDQARLVELRFFGGLTIEEVAVVLGVSPATVKRNWNVAKAWLARELRTERNRNA